jgi:hypothetical protein
MTYNDIQGMLDRRELKITYKRNKDENDEVFVIVLEFNIPEPVEVTFNSQQFVVTPLVIYPSVHDLCLVPNVRIPTKFRVLEFEKYRGNSCPRSHLVMHDRKISTQTDNHQLLINYFQDSLTGDALKWYMGLDSANN